MWISFWRLYMVDPYVIANVMPPFLSWPSKGTDNATNFISGTLWIDKFAHTDFIPVQRYAVWLGKWTVSVNRSLMHSCSRSLTLVERVVHCPAFWKTCWNMGLLRKISMCWVNGLCNDYFSAVCVNLCRMVTMVLQVMNMEGRGRGSCMPLCE